MEIESDQLKDSQKHKKKYNNRTYGQLQLNKKNLEKASKYFIKDQNTQNYIYQNAEFFNQWDSEQIDEKIKNQHLQFLVKQLETSKINFQLKQDMLANDNFMQSLDNVYSHIDSNLIYNMLQLHFQFCQNNPSNFKHFFKLQNFAQFFYNISKIIDETKEENIRLQMLQIYYAIIQKLAHNKNYWYKIQKSLIKYVENVNFLNFNKFYILDVFLYDDFLRFSLEQQIQFSEDEPETSLNKSYHEQYLLGLATFIKAYSPTKDLDFFFIYQKILPFLQFFDSDDNRRKVVQILHFEIMYGIYLKMTDKTKVNEKYFVKPINQNEFDELYLYDYNSLCNLIENKMFIEIFGSNQQTLQLTINPLLNSVQDNFNILKDDFEKFWNRNINEEEEIRVFTLQQDDQQLQNYFQQLKSIFQKQEFAELLHSLRQLKCILYDNYCYADGKTYIQNFLQENKNQDILKHFSIGQQEDNIDKILTFNEILNFQIAEEYFNFIKQQSVQEFYRLFCNFIEQFFQFANRNNTNIFDKNVYRMVEIYGIILDILVILMEKKIKKQQEGEQDKEFFKNSYLFFQNIEVDLEQFVNSNQRFIQRYVSRFINLYAMYPKNLDFLTNYKKYALEKKEFQEQLLKTKIDNFHQEFQKLDKGNGSNSLTIDRERLYEQVKKYFDTTDAKKLRNRFSIKFKNEPGVDAGGLRREFFFLLGEDIFSKENGLFQEPNQESLNLHVSEFFNLNNPQEYYFVGQFLAVSIINKQTVIARLQEILLKMILNKHIVFHDYKKFDPQQYQSLMYIMGNYITEDLELYFEIQYKINGQEKTKQLIKNGRNIQVLEINKKEYVFNLVKFLTYEKYKKAIDNLIQGFHSIIPVGLLQQFSSEELGCLISGDSIVFAGELIDNITCGSGYTRSSETIQFLFQYLKELEKDKEEGQNMLRGFLQFVTGSGQVPYGGLRNLRNSIGSYSKININHSSHSTQSLPTASTCSNCMRLPKYPTYEILKQKLDAAIKYGRQGFAFG